MENIGPRAKGLEFARTAEAPASEKKVSKPKLATKVLDMIISVSIFMLFLGLPVFFTGLTFQGVIFEKQIFFYFWTLLALVSWAGKGVVMGEMKIRRTPLDMPILLFWVVYLLATIFSVDRWHSLFGSFTDPSRGFMNVTALIIVYYVIMSNFSMRKFRWIAAALVTSGAVVFVWSVLGIFNVNFLPAKFYAFAPLSLLGSLSGLGMFLSILLPIIITVVFKLRSDMQMKVWLKNGLTGLSLIFLALDLFLLLALYGFVPWIGFMIGVGFFLIFIFSRVVRPVDSWTWLPMGTFVLLMVIMMAGNSFRIARVQLPVEVGPDYSLSWQVAKESVKSKFLLGSGAGTYGYDFSLHKPEFFNLNQLYNLRFYQGTGIFFESLATMGVLGTLVLILAILSFISVVIYLLIVHKEKDKVYSLGFVTAALIFIASALLTRVDGTLLIFGALVATVALAIVAKESDSEEKFLNLSLKASPKYALALAFIFMVVSAGVAYLFVFVGKTYVADIYAGMASRQQQVTEEGSIGTMLKAINLNGQESKYYTNVAQQYMVLANDEVLKGDQQKDVNLVQRYLNNSIAAAEKGRDLAPNDVSASEALGQVYSNTGFYVADSLRKADETYSKALQLEPNNPVFTLELGKNKLNQAAVAKTDDEKKQLVNQAKDLFQQSVEQKQNFGPGFYQLAMTQQILGDLDGAIENMSKAVSLENSNMTYIFNLARLYQQRGKDDDNKIAEAIFQKILGVNDKEINTHFSLAMLYEKMNQNDKAIAEYQKVVDLLPTDNKDTVDKVKKMIENIKNGVSNLTSAAQTTETTQGAAQ